MALESVFVVLNGDMKMNFECVKNGYGVTIKKICASCVHVDELSNSKRSCRLHNKEVYPVSNCKDWRMQPRFASAGKGDGSVKPKLYMIKALLSWFNKDVKYKESNKPRIAHFKGVLEVE